MIKVSVIITTKNEEKHIGNCLRSIKNQSAPGDIIEIIVVDNNSTDETARIADEFTKKIYNKGPERSSQRNFGALQATGKYILYLDADMVLSKDVISNCLEKAENEGYIALYIPEKIIGKGFWTKVRDFERSFYNATVIDCVRFVRRDKFLEISGFDEGLTGPEDWDFDRRIAAFGKTSIITAPIYHNEEGFGIKKYLSKKVYYTKSMEGYIRKWGKDDAVIKKQLGLGYRYFIVFIENRKFWKLLAHPILAFFMYILKVQIGLVYLFTCIARSSIKTNEIMRDN